MFQKVLIANRGEIAVRIIRACNELNIRTVVVYSQADEESLPVQMADQHVCIGPASPLESYLRIDRIISAAEITDVDAIHPGYGFLAENAHFADICRSCNIKFIGPTAEQINALGDKARARETMKQAGVPVTPGSDGLVETEKEALRIAHVLGYPVVIKATGGGGGRGIRVVHNDASLVRAFHACRTEAEQAFGNRGVYMEKFVEKMRHIEFQILADEHGHTIHLGERDCSIQRRRQKLIEETPSPIMTPALRQRMGEAAVAVAQAASYTNAGTVEFIFTPDGQFYFMEMNTRVQVEHPVTEEVTGVDLIKAQIRIAAGEGLPWRQEDIVVRGHAIECRINAENPQRDFAPSPGLIQFFQPPGGPGVRLDTHIYNGYHVPPYYDSLLAKLVVRAPERQECIARARRALDELEIEGVHTTIDFLKFVLNKNDFIRGEYDTGLAERLLAREFPTAV